MTNEWHSPSIVSLQPKSHSTLLGFHPYEEKLWAGKQAEVKAGGQCYYRV